MRFMQSGMLSIVPKKGTISGLLPFRSGSPPPVSARNPDERGKATTVTLTVHGGRGGDLPALSLSPCAAFASKLEQGEGGRPDRASREKGMDGRDARRCRRRLPAEVESPSMFLLVL